jgi:hypothetical protein
MQETAMPHIIKKPPEWYSSHCGICGKTIATRKGFKEGVWQCDVEYSDDSHKQIIVCGNCLEVYNIR